MRSAEQLVSEFIDDAAALDPPEAEQRLLPVLKELTAADGFDLVEEKSRPGRGEQLDFVATHSSGGTERLGVEYKHYRASKVPGAVVDQAAGAASRRGLTRVVLIASSGFTQEAIARARETPVDIQLFDFEALRVWARRADADEAQAGTGVQDVIVALSRDLARIVARDPTQLDHLEWRDLERMMAVVLDRLGFDAELTPGSKDGGKDVVLSLRTAEGTRTYLVELKHWRAGGRVGESVVRDFVEVVARERRAGGLMIATHGFGRGSTSVLSEIEQKVRLGEDSKVVHLCRTYVKAEQGLWHPTEENAIETLFESTIGPVDA